MCNIDKLETNDKDPEIYNQFLDLFNNSEGIKSIGIAIYNSHINTDGIYINGLPIYDYYDEKSDNARCLIIDMESELTTKTAKCLDKQDIEKLKKILNELNVKYTSRCDGHEFIKAVKGFDFSKIKLEPFINFFGKRAFNLIEEVVFFTINRDGRIEVHI